MTWLLDGNLLVAHCIDTHVHHQLARAWFADQQELSLAARGGVSFEVPGEPLTG